MSLFKLQSSIGSHHSNDSNDSNDSIVSNINIDPPKSDYRMLTFCLANLILNMGVSVVIPFYPPLANIQAGLSFTQIGIVISCSPLGSMFAGLIVSPKLNQLGRKNLLIWSLVVQSISVFSFALLYFLTPYQGWFLTISIISRLVQGISRAIYATVTFAYVPMFWPNEIQSRIGILESVSAIGLMLGPLLGAALNVLGGYMCPFIVIAAFFTITIVPSLKCLPQDTKQPETKPASLGSALKSGAVVSTFFLMMSVIAALTYIGPIFVHHMASFGIDQNVAALLYAIPIAAYLVSLYIVPKLQNKFQKTLIMSFGLMLAILSAMLLAPFWTGDSNTYAWVIVGQLLGGAAQACSVIPSIPRLIDIMSNISNPADVASGLFVTALSIGAFIAPVIAGSIYDGFNGNTDDPEQEKKAFQYTMLVLVGFLVIALLQFMLFGGGYQGWRLKHRPLEQELLVERKIIVKE